MGILDGLTEASTGIFGTFGRFMTIMMVVLFFAVIGGIFAYFLLNAIKYNKKITILENLSGMGFVPTGKDRARTVKISDAGEEVLFLRKRKLYKGAYGKKIGKNHYAFAVGRDGYWYNITFGDLDYTLSELKMTPIDRDMRYAHEGIRKNVSLRFDKESWWKQNIGVIFGVVAIIMVLVFLWLLADKYFTIFSAADASLAASEKVLDRISALLGNMDNICSGGSGFRT